MQNKNLFDFSGLPGDSQAFVLKLCPEGRVNRPRHTRQAQVMSMLGVSPQRAARILKDLEWQGFGRFVRNGHSRRNIFRWSVNALKVAHLLRVASALERNRTK